MSHQNGFVPGVILLPYRHFPTGVHPMIAARDFQPCWLRLVLLCLLLGQSLDGSAADAQAPIHEGVASCASGTCHGAIEAAPDGHILGNEYVTWTRRDAHARAYATLQSPQSQRIAGKLGLPSAVTAQICLDCHTDNVPAAQRGARFQLSDGVGCEACHGGAGSWLAAHAASKGTHADNLKAGLYPTDAPVERAKLCLSCHFGNARKFVTHRLMGAGHPRMSFELDTFTALQPAHFRVDADYRQRKSGANGVQVWALGQAVAVTQFLDNFIRSLDDRNELFPELVFFDCHACHHPMRDQRWQPQPLVGLGPGRVRLNDAHFLMLRHIALRVDPALGARLSQQILALHQATAESHQATRAQAQALRKQVDSLVPRIAVHDFSATEMRGMLDAIIMEGQHGEDQDYVAAEQATMAIATLTAALENAGALSHAQTQSIDKALAPLYDAVQHDEHYRPAQFSQALRTVRGALPR